MRSPVLTALTDDLGAALRGMARAPLFAAVVVLTSAIGIGATVAIFSVVNAMVLRPLPFAEGERLVRLRDVVGRAGAEPRVYNNAPRNVIAIRESGIFENVVGQEFRRLNLTEPGEPRRVVGIGVSPDWNSTLGVWPILGRPFTPREEQLGPDAGVLLLGHELWQRRFAGAADVIGRRVVLNGRAFSVVGVMPQRFDYPYGADLWFPQPLQADAPGRFVNGAARLRPGQTLAAAQARLDDLAARLAAAEPATNAGIGLRAVPMRDNLLGNQAQVASALLVTVALLMLLAVVSVADLVVVRNLARRGELAVRAALGGSRARQVWQLTVEGLVLVLAGGAVGLLLAWSATPLLGRLTIEEGDSLSAFFRHVNIDHRVALFALAVTAVTGLLAAGVPAALLYRPDPAGLLRSGQRASAGREGRPAAAMVVVQVGVALALLAGAGLMLRHLDALEGRDLGYRTEDTFAVQLILPAHRFETPEARIAFVDEALERVRALPGVRAAGVSHYIPSWGGSQAGPYSVEGGPVSTAESYLLTNVRYVSAGYLDALGVPLLRGRTFEQEESLEPRQVVVVSRSLAERAWPGEDPLGRRIRPGTIEQDREWLTVVGVVGDVEETHDVEDTWYLPYPLAAPSDIYLVVQAEGGLAPAHRAAITDALRAIDPEQPVDWVRSLTALHAATYENHATGSVLMATFAGFGLLVAALAIYGVVAAHLARRRRELAVRMALGASPGHLAWLVLRRGLALTLVGLAVGGLAALALVQLLVRTLARTRANVPVDIQLVETANADLYLVCLTAMLVVATVAAAASLLPATAAARTQPARALLD